jgi:hypothetical protein
MPFAVGLLQLSLNARLEKNRNAIGEEIKKWGCEWFAKSERREAKSG